MKPGASLKVEAVRLLLATLHVILVFAATHLIVSSINSAIAPCMNTTIVLLHGCSVTRYEEMAYSAAGMATLYAMLLTALFTPLYIREPRPEYIPPLYNATLALMVASGLTMATGAMIASFTDLAVMIGHTLVHEAWYGRRG